MRQVVIYVDEGVSGESLRHTVKSLRCEIDKSAYCLRKMDAEALSCEKWEEQTDLLVVPGGKDVFYHKKLELEGVRKIKNYIEGGGNYLGICAGAYFAASEIEFEKGGYLEVCAKRSLSFFPGKAVGSAFGLNKYHDDSERGAEAALICWDDSCHCYTYFNGGCFFEAPEQFSQVRVLARYAELDQSPAAIVLCQVGKGKALLTGIHLEYNLSNLVLGNPYLEPLLKKLEKTDQKRRQIFRELLEHVKLKLI